MTLQRAWRRRMRRGTPIWAKGWLVRRKKEKELRRQQCMPSWQKAALEAAKWRPFFTAKKGMRRAVSVASAAATFFSFSGFPQLIHLASAQSDISTTGRTETTVAGNDVANANVNITTDSHGGDNALNDFGRFNVSAGDTVNLILPDGTKNLLNFVHDGRTVINGDLYSKLSNGAVGGNVWLLNPSGVIVGAAGSVNVGSLTVETPTTQAMNQLLYSLMGRPDSAAHWYVDKDKLENLDVSKLKELNMASADENNLASIASLGAIRTNAGGLNMYTAGTVDLINQAYVNVDDKLGNKITTDADGNVEIVAANVNLGKENTDTTSKAINTTIKASGDINVNVSADSKIDEWAFGQSKAGIQVDNASIEGASIKLNAEVTPSEDKPSAADNLQNILDKASGDSVVKDKVDAWTKGDASKISEYAENTSKMIGTLDNYKTLAADGYSALSSAKDALEAAVNGDKDAALDGLAGTASDTLHLVGDVTKGSKFNAVSAEASITVKNSTLKSTTGNVDLSASGTAQTSLEGEGGTGNILVSVARSKGTVSLDNATIDAAGDAKVSANAETTISLSNPQEDGGSSSGTDDTASSQGSSASGSSASGSSTSGSSTSGSSASGSSTSGSSTSGSSTSGSSTSSTSGSSTSGDSTTGGDSGTTLPEVPTVDLTSSSVGAMIGVGSTQAKVDIKGNSHVKSGKNTSITAVSNSTLDVENSMGGPQSADEAAADTSSAAAGDSTSGTGSTAGSTSGTGSTGSSVGNTDAGKTGSTANNAGAGSTSGTNGTADAGSTTGTDNGKTAAKGTKGFSVGSNALSATVAVSNTNASVNLGSGSNVESKGNATLHAEMKTQTTSSNEMTPAEQADNSADAGTAENTDKAAGSNTGANADNGSKAAVTAGGVSDAQAEGSQAEGSAGDSKESIVGLGAAIAYTGGSARVNTEADSSVKADKAVELSSYSRKIINVSDTIEGSGSLLSAAAGVSISNTEASVAVNGSIAAGTTFNALADMGKRDDDKSDDDDANTLTVSDVVKTEQKQTITDAEETTVQETPADTTANNEAGSAFLKELRSNKLFQKMAKETGSSEAEGTSTADAAGTAGNAGNISDSGAGGTADTGSSTPGFADQNGLNAAVSVSIHATKSAVALNSKGSNTIKAGTDLNAKANTTDQAAQTKTEAYQKITLTTDDQSTKPAAGQAAGKTSTTTTSTAKKNVIAAAVSYTHFGNESAAVIGDDANVDAGHDLNVNAQTTFGNSAVGDVKNLVQAVKDGAGTIKTDLKDGDVIKAATDGKEVVSDIQSKIPSKDDYVTTWTQSAANGSNLAGAASINVLSLENKSHASIGKKASVNQTNSGTDAEGKEIASGTGTVSVQAETDSNDLNMAGVFGKTTETGDSGSDTGSDSSGTDAADTGSKTGTDTAKASGTGKDPNAVTGTETKSNANTAPGSNTTTDTNAADGKAGTAADTNKAATAKNGIGGSLQITLHNNTTEAVIDQGAKVRSGSDVTANAAVDGSSMNLAVAGGKAASIGFNGTLGYNGITDTTKAAIDAAVADGGNVSAAAADSMVGVNVGGGITKSQSVGIGATINVNDTQRDTSALLAGNITAGGDAAAVADNNGTDFALSVAGAMSQKEKEAEEAAAQPSADTGTGTGAGTGVDESTVNNYKDVVSELNTVLKANSKDKAAAEKKTAAVTNPLQAVRTTQDKTAAAKAPSSGKTSSTTANAGETLTKNLGVGTSAGKASTGGQSGAAGDTTTGKESAQAGAAVAGSVSVNLGSETASAQIGQAGTERTAIKAKNVRNTAANESAHIALSGTMALQLKEKTTSADTGGATGAAGAGAAGNSTTAASTGTAASAASNAAGGTSSANLTPQDTQTAEKDSYAIAGSFMLNRNEETTKAAIENAAITVEHSLVNEAANHTTDVTIAASAAGAAKGYGAAGQVSVNLADRDTSALVKDSTITQTNTTENKEDLIGIAAEDSSNNIAVSGAAGAGSKAGVGASIGVNVIQANTTAGVENTGIDAKSAELDTNARQNTKLINITAAGAASKGKMAGAFAASGNAIVGHTAASIDNSAAVQKTVESAGEIHTDAADHSLLVNVVGSAAIAQGQEDTTASGTGTGTGSTTNAASSATGSTASTAGSVVSKLSGSVASRAASRQAADKASTALSSNMTNSLGQKANNQGTGIGAAAGVNVVKNTVDAYIGDKTTVKGSSVDTTADGSLTAVTIAAGGAYAGKNGAAGALNVNVLGEEVQAALGASSKVTSAQGDVTVQADNALRVVSVAGALGVGGTNGVGGGADVEIINTRTDAFTGDNSVVTSADDIDVKAESKERVTTVAAAGASGSSVAAAGAVNANVMNTETRAAIGKHAKAEAQDSAAVSAQDDSVYTLVAGSAAVSKKSGTGTAGAAGTSGAAGTAGTSGSGSSSTAAGGAAAVGVIHKTVQAEVGEGATVNAYAKAGTKDSGLAAYNGTIDAGYGDYSDEDTNEAKAAKALQSQQAMAEDSSSSTDAEKELHAQTSSELSGDTVSKERTASAAADTMHGLSVTATSEDSVRSVGAGAAAATQQDGKAFEGAVGVNEIEHTTEAVIDSSAKINTSDKTAQEAAGGEQNVRVRAANDTYHLAVTGGAALASGTAVGGSADVAVITNKTTGSIADSAAVAAKKDVSVQAENKTVTTAIAAAGAASTQKQAVAGSVNADVLQNTVTASVGKTTVIEAGGGLDVQAESENHINTAAGGAAIAKDTGVGAAVNASVTKDETKAYIDDEAVVDAAKGVAVQAVHTNQTLNIAAGLGVSTTGSGGAGSLALDIGIADTEAWIGKAAKVNQNEAKQKAAAAGQSVIVKAKDTTTRTALGATLAAAESAGVGAGILVDVQKNTTSAYIADGAAVAAKKDVQVESLSTKDVKGFTASLAGSSSGAAAAGSVGVYYIGGGTNGDADDALASTGAESVQKLIGSAETAARARLASSDHELLAGQAGDPTKASGADAVSSTMKTAKEGSQVAGDTSDLKKDTSAYIGDAAVKAESGKVDVSASDDVKLTTVNGTAAVSGSSAAVGGAVGVDVINSGANAAIFSGASVSSGLDTSVHADAAEHLNNAVAGGTVSGSSAGVTGVLAVAVDNENATASVGGDDAEKVTDLNAAKGSVEVTARHTAEVNNIAGALGIGSSTGVGLGVGTEIVTNQTKAIVGDGTTITAGNDAAVTALSDTAVNALSVAGAAGGTAGVGAAGNVHVLNETTAATIGRSSVAAKDSVALTAMDDSAVNFLTGSAAGAGTTAVGGALGVSVVNKTVKAEIADGAVVDAQGSGDGISAYTGNTESKSIGEALKGAFTNTSDKDVEYKQDKSEDGTASASSVKKAKLTDASTSVTDKNAKATIHGIDVAAGSAHTLRTIGAAAGGAGSAAVMGTIGAANTVNDVTAKIGKASINQNAEKQAAAGSDQAVLVRAHNENAYRGLSGAVSGSGSAAVSGGAVVNHMKDTTTAENDGQVTAKKEVKVLADASHTTINTGVSAGAAGSAAVAGAFDVNFVDSSVAARMGESAKARSQEDKVIVEADNTNTAVVALTGAALGGSVGVGTAVTATVDKLDTTAEIGANAVVDAKKGVDVTADTTEDLTAVTAGVAGSGTVAASGALGVNVSKLHTTAAVDNNAKVNQSYHTNPADTADAGQSVQVKAKTDAKHLSVGAAAAVGGQVGVGAGVVVDVMNADTTATIGSNAQVYAKKDIAVTADSSKTVTGYTGSAGGGAGVAAAAGSLGVYTVSGTAEDKAAGTQTLTDKTKDSYALSDSDAFLTKLSKAMDDATKIAQAELTKNSGKTANGQTIGSYGAELSGSTAVDAKDKFGTQASIGGGAVVHAGNDVAVQAADDTTVDAVTGSVGAGMYAAVGASVGVVAVHNTVGATIDAAAAVTADGEGTVKEGDKEVAGGVRVKADGRQTTKNITAAATASYYVDPLMPVPTAVAAISVPVTVNDETVTAASHGNVTAAKGSIATQALNTVDAGQYTGNLGIALQGVGAGLGVADNNVSMNTQALADGTLTAGKNVIVQANSEEALRTVMTAASGGLYGGVDANVNVRTLSVNTTAELGGTVTAGGSVVDEAAGHSDIDAYINSLQAGGAAAGGAVDTEVVTKNTTAKVQAKADIQADGSTEAEIATGVKEQEKAAASRGTQKIEYDENGRQSKDISLDAQDSYANDSTKQDTALKLDINRKKADITRQSVKGVAVSAVEANNITNSSVGGSVGGVAGNGTLAVEVVKNTTTAQLAENAKINTRNSGRTVSKEQQALLAAHTDMRTTGYSTALSGGVAAGNLDAGISSITNQTQAQVKTGGELDAEGNVTVSADNENLVQQVKGLASIGGLGVNLQADGLILKDEALAQTDAGSSLNSKQGNVTTDAENKLTERTLTGSLSAGGVGAGAAVNVVRAEEGAKALLHGNAKADAGDVAVHAANTEDVISVSTGVGAGVSGAAEISANVHMGLDRAVAETGDGTEASTVTGKNIGVKAENTGTRKSLGANMAVGGLGALAGGADIGIFKTDTIAAIRDHADVTAANNVDVNAVNTQSNTGFSGNAALAGGAGAGASLTIAAYGTGTAGEAQSDQKKYLDAVNDKLGFKEDAQKTHISTGKDDTQKTEMSRGAAVQQVVTKHGDDLALTASADGIAEQAGAETGTQAKIGQAKVTAAKTLSVKSEDQITHTGFTGAAGAAGTAAMGAAVNVTSIHNVSEAGIAQGAEISAGSLIADAASDHTVTTTVAAGAAAAGLAAAGAGSWNTDASDTRAHVDAENMTAGSVSIQANAHKNAAVNTTGGSAAVMASVAGSLSKVTISGSTTATLGDGTHGDKSAQVTGDVTIAAESDGKVTAKAVAPSLAAGFAAGLSKADITNATTTQADIAANYHLAGAGRVDIESTAAPELSAAATGVAGAGAVASGVVSTVIHDDTTVKSLIGDGAVLGDETNKTTVGRLTLTAKKSQTGSAKNAKTDTVAGAASLLAAGAAAQSAINQNDVVQAIAGGKDTKILAGDVEITAEDNNTYGSTMDVVHAAIAGLGGAKTVNTITADTRAGIGGSDPQTNGSKGTTLMADTLTVNAKNKTTKAAEDMNVHSASGGLADGAAIHDTQDISHTTQAFIGNDAVVHTSKAITGNETSRGLVMNAESNVDVTEKNKLSAGAAISLARVENQVAVNKAMANKDDEIIGTNVRIGKGAAVTVTEGDLDLTARNMGNITADTLVDVYGAVGVRPSGQADIQYNGKSNITQQGAITVDHGSAYLLAGRDADGNQGKVTADSVVHIYNKTALPIEKKPEANASIQNNTGVDLQTGSSLSTSRNIYLTAATNADTASYTGEAKSIYSEIGGKLLGDEDAFTLIGGSAKADGKSVLTLNGKAETGIHRTKELTLSFQDEKTNTETGEIELELKDKDDNLAQWGIKQNFTSIAANMITRYKEVLKLMTETKDTVAIAAYDAELKYLQDKMVAMGIGSITGTGEFVPASGAESEKDAAERLQKMYQVEFDNLGTKIIAVSGQMDGLDAAWAIRQSSDIGVLQNAYNTFSAIGSKTADDVSKVNQAVQDYNKVYGTNLALITYDQTAVDTMNTAIKDLGDKIHALTKPVASEISADALSNANKTLEAAYGQSKISVGNNATILYGGDSVDLGKAFELDVSGKVVQTADTATFKEAQTAVQDKIKDIQKKLDNNEYSTEQDSYKAKMAEITGNVTAERGSIYLQADNVQGSKSGSLDAPGDASIKIINKTPAFLEVKGNLVITDGGNVYRNGETVIDAAGIAALNKNNQAYSTEGMTVLTKKDATAQLPVLEITSTFNPSDYKGTIYYNAAGEQVSSAVEGGYSTIMNRYITPDITIDGALSNTDGNVRIAASHGSIYLGDTASITAGTVDVSAAEGDYVQGYSTQAFNHVGGTATNETENSEDLGKYNTKQGNKGIYANGKIVIGARYLNINGKIQSGTADWNVTIPSADKMLVSNGDPDHPITLKSLLESGQKLIGKIYIIGLEDGSTDKVASNAIIDGQHLYYDADNQCMGIGDIDVKGGSITLSGQIFNTNSSGGSINALAGYGKINVQNDSGYALNVGSINTGNGTDGTITINDVHTNGTIYTTKYTGHYNDKNELQIRTETSETTYNKDKDGYIQRKTDGTLSAVRSDPKTVGDQVQSEVDYTPESDLKYVYTTGNSFTDTQHYHYEGTKFIGIKVSSESRLGDKVNETIGAVQTLADGKYLTTDTPEITLEELNGAKDYYNAQLKKWQNEGAQLLLSKILVTSQAKKENIQKSLEVVQAKEKSVQQVINTLAGLTPGKLKMDPSKPDSINNQLIKVYTLSSEVKNVDYEAKRKFLVVKKERLDYDIVTGGELVDSHYYKADNPIKVGFSGYAAGAVDISNKNAKDMKLDGTIQSSGMVKLTNENGRILQDDSNDSGLIKATSIELDAKQIGTESQAVRVDTNAAIAANDGTHSAAKLAAKAVGTGAVTVNGNALVNLEETNGDLRVDKIAVNAGEGAASKVILEANGSILNAGTDSLIQADRVNLVSNNGTLGTKDSMLSIQTGAPLTAAGAVDYTKAATETGANYGVNARAHGDVYLDNKQGDLFVDRVVSDTGDVNIKTAGTLVDNEVDEHIDQRSWDELTKYWSSLGLVEGSDAAKQRLVDAQNDYRLNMDASYQEYWASHDRVTKDSNGQEVYTASASEKQSLQNAYGTGTEYEAKLAAYEQTKLENYHKLQADDRISKATDTYKDTFRYTLTDADESSIEKNAWWTKEQLSGLQLSNLSNVDAVTKAQGKTKTLTDTNYVIKDANVQGKNITLSSGAIGSDKIVYDKALSEVDPAALTPAERVALAAAERTDYSVAGGKLTVTSRQPLNILLNGGSLTATATAENNTKGNVYLASEGDILLNKVDSLAEMHTEDAVYGNVRIKSAKSIYGLDKSDTGDTTHVGGVNVLLEAGSGTIGESSDSEDVKAKKHSERIILSNKRAVTARSGKDMKLAHTGKFFVDSLYSPGNIDITGKNGVQLAYQSDGNTSIIAGSLNMQGAIEKTKTPVAAVSGMNVPMTTAAPVTDDNTIGTKENPLSVYTGDGAQADADTDIYLKGSNLGLLIDNVDAGSHKVVIDGYKGDVLTNGKAEKADIIAKEVNITNASNIGIGAAKTDTTEAKSKIKAMASTDGTPLKIAADSVLAEASGTVNLKSVAADWADSSIRVQHIIADTVKLETERGSILKDTDYAAGAGVFSGVRAHDITLMAAGDTSDIGAKNPTNVMDSSGWLYIDPVAQGTEKGLTNIHAGHSVYIKSDTAIGGGEGFKADQGDLSVDTTQDIKTDNMSAEKGAIVVQTTGKVEVSGAVKAQDAIQMITDQGISIGGDITAGTAGTGSVSLTAAQGGIQVKGIIHTGAGTEDKVNLTAKSADGKAGSIEVGGIESEKDVTLEAAQGTTDDSNQGNIQIGSLTIEDGDLKATSASGGIQIDMIELSGKAELQAKKDIAVASAKNLTVTSASSTDGSVELSAAGDGNSLKAGAIRAATGVTAQSENISLGKVVQNENSAAPLQVELHAANGGEAKDVKASISSTQGVLLKDLHAAQAEIQMDTDHLSVRNARISSDMDLSTSNGHLAAHHQLKDLQGLDGLLYANGSRMDFSMDGHDISGGVDSFLYKKSTLTYDGGFNSRQLGLDAAPYTADNLQKSREELLSGQVQLLNSMPPMPMQAETVVSSVEIAAPSEQMVMDANGNIDIVGGDKENNAEAAGTKKDEE